MQGSQRASAVPDSFSTPCYVRNETSFKRVPPVKREGCYEALWFRTGTR